MKTHPDLYAYFLDNGNKRYANERIYRQMAKLLDLQKLPKILPPVKVALQHQPLYLRLTLADPQQQVSRCWQLQLEDGRCLSGKVKRNAIQLPSDLPLGYHELSVGALKCRVIITPKTAYQVNALQAKQRLWGAILQLYTLRSAKNWGVGDFGDLQQFLTELAAKGGSFVGLNPIHALFPANPEAASPYSPSSRLWLNMLYLDLNQVPAFQQSPEAQAWFHSQAVQDELAALRANDSVQYAQVMRLKLHALRLAYAHFSQQDQTAFERFIAQNGEALQIQATFDALHQTLSEQHADQWGWNCWFAKFQDFHTACVGEFRAENAELVRFYMWLQWLASEQLRQCDQLAKQLKMPIGFYRDLAVGVADNGAETWADKSLYVLNASIGAPPDMLAPQGQNWGLSPMHPVALKARGYQPFIDLLRANMKDCGALRIDHVLGLMRLWWVAKGDSAQNGIYVRYPLEDLLGILALESQRHQCLIIAEALGTVPKGIVEALHAKGILTFNLFYFEYEGEQCKPLANYPYSAMTTLSTHDLPTIKGYWEGYDFVLGKQFGVYPSEKVRLQVEQTRREHKAHIRQALAKAGFTEAETDSISSAFNHQLQRYVAGTNSALFATQPEDWLNIQEPVNIPGTSTEYPNWRRKLSHTTEAIFQDEKVNALLNEMNAIRHSD